MTKIIKENPDVIDLKIQKKIMDLQFYRQVQELSDQLCPVAIAQDKSQADTTTLADAYDIMNKLMNEPLLASRRRVVCKHRDQAILPCHMAA